ncbi:indole-3-glycerol phosphate synthase TrpC [Enterococcus sp. AZ196]|uniref:indole-3-glycerol phosphate synthase TrpC n=1 Tax=Enterococcus sp. AZ196 TaxID=2774659 RepID=UPI003D2724AF
MDFLSTILIEKEREVENLTAVQEVPEKSRPSFYQTVKEHPEKMHVIGEIKRASPSKGTINDDVDILQQAEDYEKAGVSAISVLTDPVFFKGKINDLAAVAQVVDVPILCKDFIIDERQLDRAKKAGASMVLLIVAALSASRLAELYQQAQARNLEVLMEVHNADELAQAQAIGANIIGINNRNLKTFKVSLQTSIELAQPEGDVIYISESGFKIGEDVEKVKHNYHGVLVGETLMRAANPVEKVRELQVRRK